MGFGGNPMKYELHRLRYHPLYKTWLNIKQRCTNPKRNDYSYYGGRGITVCDEWLASFQAFYDWCIANGWGKGLTIDRLNVDGNYCPENCRWVSRTVQAQNRRKQKSNTSGINGVLFQGSSWRYDITINGKRTKKRGFPSKEAALEARNQFIMDNNTNHQIQKL